MSLFYKIKKEGVFIANLLELTLIPLINAQYVRFTFM